MQKYQRATIFLPLLLCVPSIWAASPLDGDWIGGFERPEGHVVVHTQFWETNDATTGTIDLIDLGNRYTLFEGRPLDKLELNPASAHFELADNANPLSFEGQVTNGVMTGVVQDRGMKLQLPFRLDLMAKINPSRYAGIYRVGPEHFISIASSGAPWSMSAFDIQSGQSGFLFPRSDADFFCGSGARLYPVQATIHFTTNQLGHVTAMQWKPEHARALVGTPIKALQEEEVSFKNGDVTLSGTLVLPLTKGPHPAVVLLNGSGPNVRGSLRPFADFFAMNGVAALSPGFTTAAVLTVALGIGANTGIFSVVNAVLLRPLPYSGPASLVAVCESNPHLGLDDYVTSIGAYADWRRQNSVFQQLAAGTVLGPSPVLGKTGAELVHVAAVSAEFFQLLGIQPILGRQFTTEEENPDRGDAVLLSEGLWRERFGADPGVLDQIVQLGGRSFRVVGVMPASVKLFDPAGVQGWDNGFSKSDLWRPLPVASGLQKQRSYRAFLVLGRLKPNVSIAQAQKDMDEIARQEAQEFPDSNAGWTIKVRSWHSTVIRNVRLPLMLLLGAVVLVLLIATANLANLSIARAAWRQKEFEIRLALGAGRFRLARQFLAESLLLSSVGGAVGLVFARWSVSLLSGLIPENVPRMDEIGLDAWVLAFTFAISLVVGLLFGLAPLLTILRKNAHSSLKSQTRGSTGGIGGRRLRTWLVTSEVALVVVLLTGAGLLVRSFRLLNEVNPGFQPSHLVALDLSIGGSGSTNEFRRIQFVAQLLTRLSELPGVESSAAVVGLPLDAGRGSMDIALTSIEGSPPATPGGKLVAGLHLVSPEYFRTMGIPLTRGRSFTGRDNTNAPPVVIINEALVRRSFAGRSPIGERIGSPDFGPQPCEIVGVINDVKHASMDETSKPEVFRPLLQECFSSMTIVARSVFATKQTFDALRSATVASDPRSPAYNPRTLDHLIAVSLAPRRFALLLTTLFAGLALLLAVVGIYGVLSWVVTERVREIGIRLALGAQRRQVLRMILTQGMCSVIVGGSIGLAGVWVLTRLLRSLLYSVSPTDPFTLFAVALLLTVVSVAACWLPARRAARTDPMVALRHE